jgi:spore germination cell wall hydrolase CwlJ-like protein
MVMTLAHSAFANSEQNFLAQYEIEKEITCLAMNIYFESGNKSYEEKLAIATVTINRLNSPNYPKTICGVVWQKKPNAKKCQFTWTCDGKSDRITHSGKYIESLRIAKDVLINQKKSRYIDDGVLHYHANYIRPYWSYHMKRVASIGAHLFYREKT